MRCLKHVMRSLTVESVSKHFCMRNVSTKSPLYDIVIAGGGIVGLATARELALRYPKFQLAVVEKEKDLCLHQSKSNSGVIHAGVYYKPGSLKAKLCVEGLKKSYVYMDDHKLHYNKCGKLIVAVEQYELPQIDELMRRATANECPNVSIVSGDEIKEIEPNCVGLKAIHSPETGIVDWRSVGLSYAKNFTDVGGKIYTSFPVESITESVNHVDYPVLIKMSERGMSQPDVTVNEMQCKYLITCAGLQSDRIARKSGCAVNPVIMPFRGDYLMLTPEKSNLVKGNIYPVPDPRFPFLGVHFTPRIDGSVFLGPNAILSLHREGYSKFAFNFKDAYDALTHPGFIKLAGRYFSFGVNEIVSNIFISRQVKQLQRYVPSLKRQDVVRGPSGIRAQALNENGDLVDDFVIDSGDGPINKRVMHVRNAPSPAATASLAIARVLADEAKQRFGLPSGETRNKV